jgi:hypothetical protein
LIHIICRITIPLDNYLGVTVFTDTVIFLAVAILPKILELEAEVPRNALKMDDSVLKSATYSSAMEP